MRVYSAYVLVIEDDAGMSAALQDQLDSWNYEVKAVTRADQALKAVAERIPDLIISDINIEGPQTGLWVCEQIRQIYRHDYIPIVMMTGSLTERVAGLRAGADDFLNKPFDPEELAIRSETLLRIRAHLARLRRFFSPQIADLIVSDESDQFKSHRRDVTVIFVDLRGFTAFSEVAEPDDVIRVLNEYYAEVGRLTLEHKGTLGHLAGDGIMIFFNDPIVIEDHQSHAFKMVLEMRQILQRLETSWDQKGYKLSYGIGISNGMATVGAVGFREFWEYSVIGSVPNFAARLCDEAKGGEVLMCSNFQKAIGKNAIGVTDREITLKGFAHAVKVFSLE